MRLAIIVAPKVGRISGCAETTKGLLVDVSDRIANGDAFPGEYVVRIPRRFTKTDHQQWQLRHGYMVGGSLKKWWDVPSR